MGGSTRPSLQFVQRSLVIGVLIGVIVGCVAGVVSIQTFRAIDLFAGCAVLAGDSQRRPGHTPGCVVCSIP